MNILYVYAHPSQDSLNAVIQKHGMEVLNIDGHSAALSDLYAQHFKTAADMQDFNGVRHEPNSAYFQVQQAAFQQHTLSADIDAELKKIADADHIILQFPLWWFSMPAIMKGWLDRVLVKGFAYDTGKTFANGLLRGKTASLTITTQSPESAYQPNGMHAASMQDFLLPIHHTLRFAGIKPLTPFIVYEAFEINHEREEKILADYRSYLASTIVIAKRA